MKIRIATTMPIQPFRDDPIWNARTIDEFVELFVRENMLIIGDLQIQISNFVKHSERSVVGSQIFRYIGRKLADVFFAEVYERAKFAGVCVRYKGILIFGAQPFVKDSVVNI